MKKTLLMLSLAVSAFVVPVATSAEVNSELVGKEMLVGEAVTEITPGEWYLLNNVGRSNYVREETTAYKMQALPTSRSASENAGYLFKITNSTTEGKYNIQSGNGLYFELGNDNSSVSQTARDFDIQKIGSAADRFYMQDVASQFIADGQQTGENFVGWGQTIPTNTGGNSAYRFIALTIADRIFDVTYTFTTAGGQTFTRTIPVVGGENAADHIPTVDFFTATGLQEATTIVGENATTFTVTGTWDFPVSANKVYRLALKPSSNIGKVVSLYDEAGTDIRTNVTDATTLANTNLWYFKSVGYDDSGRPIFTLHSLNDDTKGVTFAKNDNGNTSTLTDAPDHLTIFPTTVTTASTDFCLQFKDGNTSYFVNDRNPRNSNGPYFSSWQTVPNTAVKDDGCVVRALTLTETDFSALAITSTATEIENAKANPTPEAISSLIDKLQANPLALAIAAAEAFEGTIGTALGQYNNADDNFADKLTAAKALLNNPDATEDQITAAIEAIAVSNLHINQPKAGHFYRFHYGDKYLSSTKNANNRFSMVTEIKTGDNSNLNNTTVFYYDGTHLVTYPEGKVMGNLSTTGTHVSSGSMSSVIKGTTYAGTIRFAGSAFEIGKYNIISTSNNRYLYHNSTNIDSGTNAANNSETGYRWEIKEVEWLPTPYTSGSGYLSICVPVDLNFGSWAHATPYIGVLQGDNIGKKKLVEPVFDSKGGAEADKIVPANTPVFLEVRDINNDCVYVNVIYSETSAQAADVTNDLTTAGLYAGATKAEGQSYFTINETGDKFEPAGANLPAFAAILTVPTANAKAEGYAITEYNPDYVSITEIEGAGNNGKQVIYDLQGRRVQRASKGLYIINGVKTFVK